jgi:hypothetical protein
LRNVIQRSAVGTREANIRCLIPSLPQAPTIMQSLAGLAAKLAVIAAAGAGLYVAYQYTDVKGVPNWTTSAASSDSKAIGNEPARASSSERRLMAEPGSCASQTWPNISPECITGQAEPTKVTERPTIAPSSPPASCYHQQSSWELFLTPKSRAPYRQPPAWPFVCLSARMSRRQRSGSRRSKREQHERYFVRLDGGSVLRR